MESKMDMRNGDEQEHSNWMGSGQNVIWRGRRCSNQQDWFHSWELDLEHDPSGHGDDKDTNLWER